MYMYHEQWKTGLMAQHQEVALLEWPQGGASGAQGSEICTRLGRWVTHIFASAVGELLWDR